MMGAWSEAGRILWQLREVRGWSQLRLAGELATQAKRIGRSLPARESLVRMIRDWENGKHRPRDYYDLLILVFASQNELAARTIEQGSDLDRMMTALKLMGISMDRRNFLLTSAAMAAGIGLESAQDEGLLSLFEDDPVSQATERLRYLQGLQWSGKAVEPIYRLFVHHAKALDTLAMKFRGSDVERELRSVQAQTFSAAGHAAFFDLGNHARAEEHLRAGIQAARASNDPRLRGVLSVNLVSRRVHDPNDDPKANLYDALWIANNALKYADGNSFILTDIHAWQALIHASLHNETGAKQALQHAATTIQHAKPDERPEWLPHVNMAQVQETAGISYLRMDQPRLAADEISRALSTREGDGDRLHRSLFLAWGAQAFGKSKEPGQAVNLLQGAIPIVSASRSALRAQEVRRARKALEPWNGEPFVRELDDQLAAVGLA